MIRRLRASANSEFLAEVRQDLDKQVTPYRSKMTTEQILMLEEQFFERRMLEAAGLPRLSLYYMPGAVMRGAEIVP